MIDVQVQVSGTIGSGRTTVANKIKKVLSDVGYRVTPGSIDSNGNEYFEIKGEVKAKLSDVFLPEQKTILDEAIEIIYGDREKTYGHPGKNCETIAEFWNTYLKAINFKDKGLTAEDVCVMMVLLKQARLATTPGHRDSLVDTAGYAALNDRIREFKFQQPKS